VKPRYFLIVFLYIYTTETSAQNTSVYTLNQIDPQSTNAAYTGRDKGNIFGHHRSQYVGLSPINFSNQFILADLPLYQYNAGVGLILQNEYSGFLSNTYVAGLFAYHTKLNATKLSFGTDIGIYTASLNQSKLTVASGNYDGLVLHNDIVLDSNIRTGTAFNAGLGIAITSGKLDFGFGVKNLFNPSISLNNSAFLTNSRIINSKLSYNIDINQSLKYTPTLVYRTDLVKINDNILTGFALRGYNKNNFDALSLFFGTKLLKKFWIYYNYDIPLNTLGEVNYGSHELLIHYKLDIKQNRKAKYTIQYNSRFL
jgi:type IX secretion system PorP/SprF family membrane protein